MEEAWYVNNGSFLAFPAQQHRTRDEEEEETDRAGQDETITATNRRSSLPSNVPFRLRTPDDSPDDDSLGQTWSVF